MTSTSVSLALEATVVAVASTALGGYIVPLCPHSTPLGSHRTALH
jgi:hypothetical protein